MMVGLLYRVHWCIGTYGSLGNDIESWRDAIQSQYTMLKYVRSPFTLRAMEPIGTRRLKIFSLILFQLTLNVERIQQAQTNRHVRDRRIKYDYNLLTMHRKPYCAKCPNQYRVPQTKEYRTSPAASSLLLPA